MAGHYQTITYTIGQEWGPDSRHGQETIVLHADGLVEYLRVHRGVHWHNDARAEQAHVRRLGEGLRAAGFPSIPDHARPPGGAVIQLSATGSEGAGTGYVHLHTAISWDGYGPLFDQCEKWCEFFRAYPKSEVPDTLRDPRLLKAAER